MVKNEVLKSVKKFRKTNGDVMGVIRTFFPEIDIDTLLNEKRK